MFEITCAFTITKNGEPFASMPLTFHNASYEDVVMVEGKIVEFLRSLNDEGKRRVEHRDH